MACTITLIGAGSAQFGFDMLGDIFTQPELSEAEIVLHDINEASLARVYQAAAEFVEAHGYKQSLRAELDRKKALQSADICVIAIEVGERFKLWEMDWRLPQQYGIRQVYGENGGPGGLFHSLRIIPPILEICQDISEICPDAWVFNYSNPMTRICTTVKMAFPHLKIVGLCHEIASLYQHLPKILETPLRNIQFRAGGLNHFSILVSASYRDSGADAHDKIISAARDYFQHLPDMGSVMKQLIEDKAGSTPMSEPALRAGAKSWAERGLFKFLLDTYGVLPITTDSHLGEYLQWGYDVSDHKGILDFYTYYKRWTLDHEPEIKHTRSERLVKILAGLLGGGDYEEAAVNLPNQGYLPYLPEHIVVEVPAKIGENRIDGIALPDINRGFASLLCNQIATLTLTAEAVLNKSRDYAIQAILADPVVDKADAAVALCDLFIEQQSPYLDYLK